MNLTLVALIAGFSAILFAVYLASRILKQETGTSRMVEIHEAIREGAAAYLHRQSRAISVFIFILTILLALTLGFFAALTFAIGAFLSALAGYIGMTVAIQANVRAAHMARVGLDKAFATAFHGGTVTGMALTGLGLLGVSLLFYMVGQQPIQIVGLGFGASLTALFARVGGGIYTKAADMGADLVGKIEVGIPEDAPQNPAVIADQVGDNVGDVAGTGSDVFQSYVCTLVAAMVVGYNETAKYGGGGTTFPLMVLAAGIFSSILATFFVRVRNGGARKAINRGIFTAAILVSIASFILAKTLFDNLNPFYATLAGIVTAVLFAFFTEYYTSTDNPPVRAVAEAAQTGPATNILMGLATGLESTAIPILIFCGVVFFSFEMAGLYGIAMAAIGFLSITATLMAISSYGPIVDNAHGIVEMSGLSLEVAEVTDALDSVGNTTKAVCKTYAVGTSVLAQVAMFSAYVQATGLSTIDLMKTPVIVGLLIGGMTTFVLCSFLIKAVGKAAFEMIGEVRRQFREIPGLSVGKANPDYAKCVDISTRAALKGLFIPALISVIAPLGVGLILGAEAEGGLIIGNIATILPMALLLMHSGTAWDNAKKYIEAGNLGGKGTSIHAAAVIGDTVGDPCKDTAGPSLSTLINVIGSIAILFATMFVTYALFR